MDDERTKRAWGDARCSRPYRPDALSPAAALLLLLLSAGACPSPAPAAGEPAAESAARAPLVRSGTAFFVSRAGYLLTSAHVVAGCARLSLWQERGPLRAAKLVAADAGLDIALLRSSGAVRGFAVIAARGTLPAGAAVSTIGFALDPSNPGVPTLSNGTVIGSATAPSGQRLLVIDAALERGNSGGPVIGRDGTLEGMIIGADGSRPEHGVAVPAVEVGKFLKSHGIAYRAAAASEAQAKGSAELLRRMSALVQCVEESGE